MLPMPSGGDGGYLALPRFTGDIGDPRREGWAMAMSNIWPHWRLAWLAMLPLLLVASLLAGGAFFSAESKGKNPLPFGPFLAAAGLWCGWQTLVSLPL
jgi:hypothetical protein